MDKYFERIKNAKSKEELQQISYEFLKNENVQAISKETQLIDGLCVYKECELNGSDKSELDMCIKTLKLPKTMVNKIKR